MVEANKEIKEPTYKVLDSYEKIESAMVREFLEHNDIGTCIDFEGEKPLPTFMLV